MPDSVFCDRTRLFDDTSKMERQAHREGSYLKMAELKKNILTQEGLRALEEELQELKVVRRKEVAQKIKEAREQGDLSENAEYDAAKDEQRDIETKIEQLEAILRNAEVIDDSDVEHDRVSVGCSVRLYDVEFEEEAVYKLVGSTEANILENKISNESPIGKALNGKKAGETAIVEGLEGTCEFKILEVWRA